MGFYAARNLPDGALPCGWPPLVKMLPAVKSLADTSLQKLDALAQKK